MKNEILFILLLLSLSCSKKEEHNKVVPNKDKTVVFFNPITLGASGVDSNLNINASFSECGEWGGNYENLKIFSKGGNYKDHFLNYRKTNVDCDKRDSNGRNIETVVIEKTIKLTDSNKKSLILYMKRMIDSKVEERFPGNSGDSFSITNSDSTFVIKVYDHSDKNSKSYYRLIKELKLE